MTIVRRMSDDSLLNLAKMAERKERPVADLMKILTLSITVTVVSVRIANRKSDLQVHAKIVTNETRKRKFRNHDRVMKSKNVR